MVGNVVDIALPVVVMVIVRIQRALAAKNTQRGQRPFLVIEIWVWVIVFFLTVGSFVAGGIEGQTLFPDTRDYWLVGSFLALVSGIVTLASLLEPVR